MYTSAIVLIATLWLMGSQACSKTLEVQWDYDDKKKTKKHAHHDLSYVFFLLWVYPIYYIYISTGMVFLVKMFIDDHWTSKYNQHGTAHHGTRILFQKVDST